MKFEVGEKILWWDGEFVRDAVVLKDVYDSTIVIKVLNNVLNDEILVNESSCDLYHKTSEDMRRLKEHIDELEYRFKNLSDELKNMIEEAENDVQA